MYASSLQQNPRLYRLLRVRFRISYTWFIFSVFVLSSFLAKATHNRAGEIVYERVNNTNSFRYRISIITYTKTGNESDAADRCRLTLNFGDGTSANVERSNGPKTQKCDHGGVMISGTNTRYNVYTTVHEFPGAGTYKLSMEDPMRIGGIVNIKDSDKVPFYLESYLTIDIGTGGNRAPVLQNPPIDNACVGAPFYHNPGAVDSEGDSLVYTLVPSMSFNGSAISGFLFPDDVNPGADNVMKIDSVTGTLSWISPQSMGVYNVAILIEEYRKNPNSGQVYKVGSILRDMQIDVGPPCTSKPPRIDMIDRTCVAAGEQLVVHSIATDPDDDDMEFTAVGFPLDDGNGGSLSPSDTVYGPSPLNLYFNWNPRCEFVRKEPYWVYFKVKEDLDKESELVYFKTLEINVVSPAVTIQSIQPQANSLIVDWENAVCTEAIGYKLYRYTDSLGYAPDVCATGVPESLGYKLIAEIDGRSNSIFTDDNEGLGLIHGQQYCYMVVTTFDDGSESYPSEESCGELIRDIPILNKVSITRTDASSGTDSIAWYKPIELKTSDYPAPYRYRLLRSKTETGVYEQVYLSASADDFNVLDTVFVDEDLNTVDNQYYYKIELLSGALEESVGNGRAASSVYLSADPGDNKLRLSWDVNVPWTNSEYVVYRYYRNPDSLGKFFVLDTVTTTNFIDTGLANLKEYTYFVRSIGNYTSDDLPNTLTNFSQEFVGIPIDNEPPCELPDKLIQGDCNLEQTRLTWENPNLYCSETDDVIAYKIYHSNFLGEELDELTVINDADQTEFIHEGMGSIAGCYAVVGIDSFGNESPWGSPQCVDNCPEYELPNVFTPGGDGSNDLFVPFPYKFIESIDIQIFNRWGVEVFSSTNPDILWDGSDKRSGEPLPAGVYYYVCKVNEIRLSGITTRSIKDHVYMLREGEPKPLAP